MSKSDIGEPLEKRSKNVRAQTRNLSLTQIHQRLEGYAGRVGFKVGRMYPEAAFERNVIHPSRTQDVTHELGHALMTPEGDTARSYTKRLAAHGQQKEYVWDGPELVENEKRQAAEYDEDVASVMEAGIARRAGVAPKLVASSWTPNPHSNPDYASLRSDDVDVKDHHAGLLEEAQHHLSQVDTGQKTFRQGRALPGTSVHAKINERAMKKNEEKPAGNKLVPPQWLGRPILHGDHVGDLETRAALWEFHHHVPRAEAEQRAHDDYVKEHRERAAAHHLAGMKAAMATGNYQDARKHWALYDVHLNSLGKNAIGAVPPEIEKRMMDESGNKVYKFRPHKGDLYALHAPSKDQAPPEGQPMNKAEPEDFITWSRAQHRGHSSGERKPTGYHHGEAWEKHKAGDHSHCTKAAGCSDTIKKAQAIPGTLQTEAPLADSPMKGNPAGLQNMQELVAEDGDACAVCTKPLPSGSVMLSQEQDPYFPRFCGPECAMKGGKSEAQKFFESMEQPPALAQQKPAGAEAQSPIQGNFASLRSSELVKAESAKQCKWRLGERRCRRVVKADYCHDHVDHWANKIRQQDHEGLEKAMPPPGVAHLNAPQLHSTYDGFMSGLKALPKGSPERGKFITQHMNHAPFQVMLNNHPQGQQIRGMLHQFMNAAGNAGFKPGATKVIAKAEALEMANKLLKALQELLSGSVVVKK